ncbi:hypothetical protein [Streptomyces sp. SID8499]|uniref:DUF6414 family protein n=1 Tax=Streptomyces sp. SID8499 TaxID=2706106 RepID=UPI0013C89DAC|nr:hypothetical protein [Streptomyces sp. SID8499]NED34123.1 hypothetical protein [Streptomyces sp. SID8499]
MPIPSLPRFLYLDEKGLGEYLSVVEEGLSDESKRRRLLSATGVDSSALGESMNGDSSSEEERVVRETASQRFIRLVTALDTAAERWRYRDVADLAHSFDEIGITDLVQVQCEVEIPPFVQMFSQPDQLDGMVNMLEALRDMAPMMGEELDGLPGKKETKAIRDLSKAMKSDVVVVGDQEEDGPKITGKLNKDYIRDAIEGEVFVLGKVAKKLKEGESHSLLAIPGASLMSRQQRRQAARQQQTDENTLAGPALTLDILAIYR